MYLYSIEVRKAISLFYELQQIAGQAGEIMQSAALSEIQAEEKEGDHNPVTLYDRKIQEFLQAKLFNLCPSAGFLGEEGDGSCDLNGLYWVVDPIDGTSNFIHDYRQSAVSIALYEGATPLLALIVNPYQNEIFSAKKGKGAFLNGRRLSVSKRGVEQALIGFGTTPYERQYADFTFETAKRAYLPVRDIRRSGSAALDLAHIAAGRLDGFFEARLSFWDFAAGRLLIEEAGGKITDFNGAPLPCQRSSVLAGNTPVYNFLHPIIADVSSGN